MSSYYELLKNSRLKKDEIEKNPLLPPFYYNNLIMTGTEEVLDTEYKFLQIIKPGILRENIGDLREEQKLYHKIDNTLLISEYTNWKTPGDLFTIETSNILSFAIIERLKDIYGVSSLEDLILTVDKNKPIDQVAEIIKDLIYSDGGVVYGFFCHDAWWEKPRKIKRTIKTRKFTITEEHILEYLKRPILINSSGLFFTDYSKWKRQAILVLKAEDRLVPVYCYRTGWVFSLTEEHLNERIEKINTRYKEVLEQELEKKTKYLEGIKKNLADYNRKTEKRLMILENYEECTKKLWEWRDF